MKVAARSGNFQIIDMAWRWLAVCCNVPDDVSRRVGPEGKGGDESQSLGAGQRCSVPGGAEALKGMGEEEVM